MPADSDNSICAIAELILVSEPTGLVISRPLVLHINRQVCHNALTRESFYLFPTDIWLVNIVPPSQ